MATIRLTGRGRRRLLGGHPWIYRDDVAEADFQPGELVPVRAPDESPLGWALASTKSKITARLVTRSSEQPDRSFWARRVRSAVALREPTGGLAPEAATRLCHGDADGLPGFILDRYADRLVVQSGCQGSDRMRDFLVELFLEAVPFAVEGVLDRSDSATRRYEGLETRIEWIRGTPTDTVEVREQADPRVAPLSYEVALLEGHKTGHYLDQVENRREVALRVRGGRVLDAFSYDGLFGIRAALAGAEEVVCLDQSRSAGERLRRNAERNGVADRVRFERENAMHGLRERHRRGERFERVVVDPPAFARQKREVEGARRGYRELHRRALSLLAPGGELFAASCSFNIGRTDFVRTLAAALGDRGPDVRIVALRGAAADHPVRPELPESEYLKALIARVDP